MSESAAEFVRLRTSDAGPALEDDMNDGWTNTDGAEDFDTIDHRLIALVERLVELTVASAVSWEVRRRDRCAVR
jgi:hypothetical protein